MRIGIVGLGKMGGGMSRRMLRGGIEVVGYDQDPSVGQTIPEPALVVSDLNSLVTALTPPRIIWLMIPIENVDSALTEIAPLLSTGDLIVDGGNGSHIDDRRRSTELAALGIRHVDCGVSGGIHGLERGYCLMLGGKPDAIGELTPLLEALVPGVDAATRTPGREGGAPTGAERGWLHCGPSGAGHLVKTIHNGIEYGLMEAYAEGLNILTRADVLGPSSDGNDGYDFDLAEITELWRRGSVIGSWLLDLTAQALVEDPMLARYSSKVSDSGEGRLTIDAAVATGTPTPVLAAALFARFASRDSNETALKVLSAMRFGFGGHLDLENGPAEGSPDA